MGNNQAQQQHYQPQPPQSVEQHHFQEDTGWNESSHRRDDNMFPAAPVERPQRPFRYREQDFSSAVQTPPKEGDPIPSSYSMQHVSYLINPSTSLNYQSVMEDQENKNSRQGMVNTLLKMQISEKKPQPYLQLYQADQSVLQGFATALEDFDRYKKQGNARAMQAFQIIDTNSAFDIHKLGQSIFLLQEGLRCYGNVPVNQVKQSLQQIEVEKQKINQQMFALQHHKQFQQSLWPQTQTEQQLTTNQVYQIQVAFSQMNFLKQKLTMQQISAADEILRVYKNKRVCLKAILEKAQDAWEMSNDPESASQDFTTQQYLEANYGLNQSKFEQWILQLVHNQNDASHFLNEYIRMVENDIKLNQAQSRIREETMSPISPSDPVSKAASAVSSIYRSELNFKQSKISDSSQNPTPNHNTLTITSNEPQDRVVGMEAMNNLTQLKEKYVENLDTLLFLLDDKRIQKHLSSSYLVQPLDKTFLEYKRDFYLNLFTLSSPLNLSFNRHLAWKISSICYKMSVQSQTTMNFGEANDYIRQAQQYFQKYKDLTKQLSKHPDLEQAKYLKNRQFLTKEQFENHRQRIHQQQVKIREVLVAKQKGSVLVQNQPKAQALAQAQNHHPLLDDAPLSNTNLYASINNEGEVGTLTGPNSKEKMPQNQLISPVKDTRKLLTEVNDQFPQHSEQVQQQQERRQDANRKMPHIQTMKLQQQRSCFQRTRMKTNFNSMTSIGPFNPKQQFDLRESAQQQKEKQMKKPVKQMGNQQQQQKNFVRMNQQSQKQKQVQALKSSQQSIKKIVERSNNAFVSTLSPKSDSRVQGEQRRGHSGSQIRAFSPDNDNFVEIREPVTFEKQNNRQSSQSSGTPRDSAYNLLKPFQQQQQQLPFYAPSSEDLTKASDFRYKDPRSKERRKISLSPRESFLHSSGSSPDQTPQQVLNMDLNNLMKATTVLPVCQWNNLGPLSVISEEKPYLQGTTYGGKSSQGGPMTFSPELQGDQVFHDPANYDQTVIKGFKLPSKNESRNHSTGRNGSHSPLSQKVLKPTIDSDLHPETEDSKLMQQSQQQQPINNQKSRAVKIVRKRQVMKERMTGKGLDDITELKEASPERDSAPCKDKQNREKQLKEEQQRYNKEKSARQSREDQFRLSKEKQSKLSSEKQQRKQKEDVQLNIISPRMKKRDISKQMKVRAENIKIVQSDKKPKVKENVLVEEQSIVNIDIIQEPKKEPGHRQKLEQEKQQKDMFDSEFKDDIEKSPKDTPLKNQKVQEVQFQEGQKESASKQLQAPTSIYKYLIDKDRKSPTFSPSGSNALKLRSQERQPQKSQTSNVKQALSDSSQIQIKVGQKPVKQTANQRQFVPRVIRHHKQISQPPSHIPNKTVSLVSSVADKSRDTMNQTQGSGSKQHAELSEPSRHLNNDDSVQNLYMQLTDKINKASDQSETKKQNLDLQLQATPKPFIMSKQYEIEDESALTQKYLQEMQKDASDLSAEIIDKKEDEKVDEEVGILKKYDVSYKDFDILRKLGKGSFGEVYLVRFLKTGELFAMKALSKRKKEDINWMRYIMTERDVLVQCQSPFIAKLNFAFQTRTNMFLVLEFCTGYDLDKVLTFEKYFKEDRAKLYTAELILAISALHQHDIIYRDLKPDNVVLDNLGHVKLIDFGMSKEGIALSDQGARTFCGSVKYLAPEMLGKKGHGKSLDWYLIGVLFYEMLVGISPYYTSKKEDLFDNILYGKLKLPRSISSNARDLIMKLLNRSSKKRLGSQIPAVEKLIVYEDGQVAEYEQKLVEQFPEIDLRRTGALQIMSHPFFHDIKWRDLYERNFSFLPESMHPPKSKYDMAYHQERYKQSRYDSDDISRIWEQKNSKEFEDDTEEPDDLHVDNWSFIHEQQIQALEERSKQQQAAQQQLKAQQQQEVSKEQSERQETSPHDTQNQITEPVYDKQSNIVSPRVAPTVQSQVSIESCSQGDFYNNFESGQHHVGRSLQQRRVHYGIDTYRSNSIQSRKTRTRSYQSQFASKSGRRGLSSGAPAERRRLDSHGPGTQKRSASLQSNFSSGNKVSIQSCDSHSLHRSLMKRRNRGKHLDKNSDMSSQMGSSKGQASRKSPSGGSISSSYSKKMLGRLYGSKKSKGIDRNQYKTPASQHEYRGNQIIIKLQNNSVGQFDVYNKSKKKPQQKVAKKQSIPIAAHKKSVPSILKTDRQKELLKKKHKEQQQQFAKALGIQQQTSRPTSNLSRISKGSHLSFCSKSRKSNNNSRSTSRGPKYHRPNNRSNLRKNPRLSIKAHGSNIQQPNVSSSSASSKAYSILKPSTSSKGNGAKKTAGRGVEQRGRNIAGASNTTTAGSTAFGGGGTFGSGPARK